LGNNQSDWEFSLVLGTHKIGKKPVSPFDTCGQLAEKGVSGIDVRPLAVFRYHQPALPGFSPIVTSAAPYISIHFCKKNVLRLSTQPSKSAW
jgi:hypothetical protein